MLTECEENSKKKRVTSQPLCKLFKNKNNLYMSCKTRMMITLGAPQILQTAMEICIVIILLNEYISQVITSSKKNFEFLSLQQAEAGISIFTMKSKTNLDAFLRRRAYGWRILENLISGNVLTDNRFNHYPFINLQSESQFLAAYDNDNSNYIVWFSNHITTYSDLDSSSTAFLDHLQISFFSLILNQELIEAKNAQTYAWQLFISQNSPTLALLVADPLKLLKGKYEQFLRFFNDFGFNSACSYSSSLSFNLLDLDPRCFSQFSSCEKADSFILQPVLLKSNKLGLCSQLQFTANQNWISFSDLSRTNLTSNNSISSAFRDLSANNLLFTNTSSSLVDWLEADSTFIENKVNNVIDHVVQQENANQESSLGHVMVFSFDKTQDIGSQVVDLPIQNESTLERDLILFISAVRYDGINPLKQEPLKVPSFWLIVVSKLQRQQISSMDEFFKRDFYHVLSTQLAISLPIMTLVMFVFLLSKLKKIVGAFVESIDWTIELMNIISGSDLFDSDIDEAYVNHFFIRYCLNTEAKELLQTYFILILKLIRSANNFFCEGQERIALERYQEAQELFERLGNQCGIGICKNNIGNIHYKQGNLVAANNLYQQSYQIAVSERDATESKEKNNPEDDLQQDIIEQLKLTVANRALQVARTLNQLTLETVSKNIADQQISQSLQFEEPYKCQSDASVRGSKISTNEQSEKLREKAVEFYSIAYNFFIGDKSRRGFSQVVFICVNLAEIYLSLEKYSQCQGMISEAHRKLEACICLTVDPRTPFQNSGENFKFSPVAQAQQQMKEITELSKDECSFRQTSPNKTNNKAFPPPTRSTMDFGIRRSSNRYRDSFPELQSPQFLRFAIRDSEQSIEASIKESLNQQNGAVRSRGDSLLSSVGGLPQPPRLKQVSLFQKLKPTTSFFNPLKLITNKLPSYVRNKSSSVQSPLPISNMIVTSGAKLLETTSPSHQYNNKDNFSFNFSPTNPTFKLTGTAYSTNSSLSTFHFPLKLPPQLPQNSLGTSLAYEYSDCKEVADKEEADKDENEQIQQAQQVSQKDNNSNNNSGQISQGPVQFKKEVLKISDKDTCEEKEDEGGSLKVEQVSPNIDNVNETSILKDNQGNSSPQQNQQTQEIKEDQQQQYPSPLRIGEREEIKPELNDRNENKIDQKLEEQQYVPKKSIYNKDSVVIPMLSDKSSLLLGSLAKQRNSLNQSPKDELFLPYSVLWMKLNLAEGRLHKSQERYIEAVQCFIEVIEHREGSADEDFSDPKDRVSAMSELISVLEQLQMIEEAQELKMEMKNMKQCAQRPIFMIDSFC